MPNKTCKAQACAIQACIVKNQYSQENCEKVRKDFMECCRKYRNQSEAKEACLWVWQVEDKR